MFKFLFVMFFFFILLVFLMGFSILRTFKNILFGSGSSNGKRGEQRRQTSTNSSRQQSYNTAEEDYTSANRKKIFAKDEGEYVDFEEVK
ncbi:DUF4834 family protein [Parabacteroides sp.]